MLPKWQIEVEMCPPRIGALRSDRLPLRTALMKLAKWSSVSGNFLTSLPLLS